MPSSREPRAARKSAAERRAEILAATETLARESGLSTITMRAVGARVGIAPTLVVHHAKSMDALVADVFEHIVSAEFAEITALVDGVSDPARALSTLLESVLDGSRTEVTRVWVESWVLGRENADLAARVRAQMDAWRALLAGLIEAGRDAGVYRVADPLAVAGQLLGMIDGIGAHSLVGWQDDKNRVDLMLRAVDAMLGVEGRDYESRIGESVIESAAAEVASGE